MVTTWTADVQLIVTTWTADLQLIVTTCSWIFLNIPDTKQKCDTQTDVQNLAIINTDSHRYLAFLIKYRQMIDRLMIEEACHIPHSSLTMLTCLPSLVIMLSLPSFNYNQNKHKTRKPWWWADVWFRARKTDLIQPKTRQFWHRVMDLCFQWSV